MKNLLKELILPIFWLLFFIGYTKSQDGIKVKNAESKSKHDGISSQEETKKTKESIFTKAVYLPGF